MGVQVGVAVGDGVAVSVGVAEKVGVGLSVAVAGGSVGVANVCVGDGVTVDEGVWVGPAVGVGAVNGWLRKVNRTEPMKAMSSVVKARLERMRNAVEFTQSPSPTN